MVRVALMGYGKAGKAVANVLRSDPRFELCWVARRNADPGSFIEDLPELPDAPRVPLVGLNGLNLDDWMDRHPVDAIVDFSRAETLFLYGEAVRQRGLMLVSAISAYPQEHLDYLRRLGESARVMASPNITLGINFLMLAARMLRGIAPFADVEIVEQHFREKPETSGTAMRLAEALDLHDERVTSLRLGGVVGHHEVLFGFPHQTVRLIHESIRREAFGTGAAFALSELAECPPGFYTFDDLLMRKIKAQLLAMA